MIGPETRCGGTAPFPSYFFATSSPARPGTMLKAKAAPVVPVRQGRLTEFLRRDLFSVNLDNVVTITAVMPEELFPIYDPNVWLSFGPAWISVEVEMREPPALPRIVTAYNSPLIG